MDMLSILLAIAEAKSYTDSVALNGVPVNGPIIDPVNKHWMVFDPVGNTYTDTGILAEGADAPIPSYVHEQTTPANVWFIQHNLGVFPAEVLIIKSDGKQVVGEIDYAASTKNLTVYRFANPYAGTAYIR